MHHDRGRTNEQGRGPQWGNMSVLILIVIDGASPYRVFRSIVLPLSVPGLVATFLFVLVFAWNEYFIALFLTSANAQTLPLTVAAQVGPVIAMAIALERFIARGLLVGAVKG